MRHKNSKKIFTYWNNLRGSRTAPDRCEIEPSDIRDILGDTFILEIDAVYKTIAFRLAGTRICTAYGRELKGVGFLGIWDEEDNMSILNAVREVYQDGKPCAISLVSQSRSNRFLEYEILLLPLLNGGSDTLRILGTASPLKNPHWIGADPIVNNRLKAVRYLEPVTDEQTPSIVPELAVIRAKKTARPKRVGHLTVFDGGICD